MNFQFADYLIVAAYITAILYIGNFLSHKNKPKPNNAVEDYILAGRQLTLPLFVGTLVASWYGNIFGVGEFIYGRGLVGWLCFGFPYYIAGLIFALFFAKKVRSYNVFTIPEQINLKYGRIPSFVASVIVLVITIPAAYILMLGFIIKLFTHWDLNICIIVAAVLALLYIYRGGFRSDVLTNTAQFILMYIGFGALLIFTLIHFGSFDTMLTALPEAHKKLSGNYSIQIIIVWFIIALQTFVDPSFHQRCSSAQTPSIAKNGILVSIIFWMIFDFFTLSTGLYARAYIKLDDPMMSFPALGEAVMPVVWKGLFLVAMLSTVMSSLTSYTFISGTTIGHDILKPLQKRFALLNNINTQTLIRFGLIVSIFFSVLLAISLPSAVGLIYKTSSIAVPGLLAPLILSYFKKDYIKKKQASIIMLTSSSTSALWQLFIFLIDKKVIILNSFVISIEPMIPGIIVSIILSSIFVIKKKSNVDNIKYY
ncbi:MAG: sodium:solute symporter family protein [Candidatus Kapabacteria bacterium]|nr:sodium:solute symporter family protein [Candidatus Kapabacteria bacterium]